jgi:hypothetical protein
MLGLDRLVFKLMILSANFLSLNTIRRRLLTHPELQKHCMPYVLFNYEYSTTNKIKPILNT